LLTRNYEHEKFDSRVISDCVHSLSEVNYIPRAEEVNKGFLLKKYLINRFIYLPKYVLRVYCSSCMALIQPNCNTLVPDGTDRKRLLAAPNSNFKGIILHPVGNLNLSCTSTLTDSTSP
jgi:hypothetical protein